MWNYKILFRTCLKFVPFFKELFAGSFFGRFIQLLLFINLFAVISCATVQPEPQDAAGIIEPADNGSALAANEPDTETMIKMKTEQILSEMSLPEKVGQMLMISIRRAPDRTTIVTLIDYVKRYLTDYSVGGVILFAANIKEAEQTRTLITDLKANSRFPLLLAIDEEGGRVSRLNNTPGLDYVKPSPAYEAGLNKSEDTAYERGRYIGRYLYELGFNLNLAPVADLYSSDNGAIADRSFSSDPGIAAKMVTSMIRGLNSRQIAAALKHFPGHGFTVGDPHQMMSVYRGSAEQFEQQQNLTPFQEGIAAGADVLLLGHFTMPQITGNDLPVCMNQSIVEGIARRQLMFDGIIMTDSLKMTAIRSRFDSGEAAVAIVKAGVDILLMPDDVAATVHSLVEAVNNGEISSARIDQSARRIIRFKLENGIWPL